MPASYDVPAGPKDSSKEMLMRIAMVHFWSVGLLAIAVTSGSTMAQEASSPDRQVDQILKRVAEHDFHPLREGFTQDRVLETDGIADFDASDWQVRLLAIRDLIRIGQPAARPLIQHLESPDLHVRQIAAKTLGLLEHEAAAPRLRELLRNDPEMVVRAQAALALGRIGGEPSLDLLRQMAGDEEATRDVRHRCQLAAYRIEHQINTSQQLRKAYRAMAPTNFGRVEVGQAPPDFTLTDTSGKQHQLSDYVGQQPIVLIWIFADWCPLCHGEFDELIKLRKQFEKHDVQVLTIQTQDRYRARVMTGEAPVEPPYWFRDKPPQQRYREHRWWPHLVDPAGRVGARFGVQPKAFAVHSEWINRPATVIIDEDGIVRFAYYGTYWGDRPSIEKTLEMAVEGDYQFTHPERLEPSAGP
jgi:peroxiredoxin